MQDAKIAKSAQPGHHRTTFSGSIFATKACIDSRKKLVKQQYLLHMSSQCLEGKRENYQVCYGAQQLCTVQCTHIRTDLTVTWIGFCLTGPISLCLDSFLLCVSLYIACMC